MGLIFFSTYLISRKINIFDETYPGDPWNISWKIPRNILFILIIDFLFQKRTKYKCT